MAKSEKMTQRQLKQPDAFQRVGADVRDWLIDHQSLFVTVAGVLLLGGLVVALIGYFSDRSEARAAKELGQALEILSRPVVPAVAGAEITPPAGEKAPFKSTQEQDQALVQSLTAFRAANSGTRAATTAALPLGKAEYRLGNHEGALAAFSDFLKKAPQNDPLRAAALEGQGYAYEAQQKYDQALASFDEMSKLDVGNYLEGMGKYHRARILILQGKKEEAAGLLSKLPTEHPNTAAARLSGERLALLTAEGVKVPEAAATPQDEGA